MALTIISVIGTYSRGGFLALSVTVFMFWLRSSGKLLTADVAAGVAFRARPSC